METVSVGMAATITLSNSAGFAIVGLAGRMCVVEHRHVLMLWFITGLHMCLPLDGVATKASFAGVVVVVKFTTENDSMIPCRMDR